MTEMTKINALGVTAEDSAGQDSVLLAQVRDFLGGVLPQLVTLSSDEIYGAIKQEHPGLTEYFEHSGEGPSTQKGQVGMIQALIGVTIDGEIPLRPVEGEETLPKLKQFMEGITDANLRDYLRSDRFEETRISMLNKLYRLHQQGEL